MKKIKALKAAVVTMALIFTVTGVAYGDVDATQFKDIDNSWAKQNIINVTEKGLMGGASADQFKPKENIKNYDVIVSIARMMNAEKAANLDQLVEKYKTNILDKFNVPEYARKYVAFGLDKGVVSDAEVSTFADKQYATKQNICKYLGKAFSVTVDSKLPPVVLPFKDSMFIASQYKPYVDFLIKNGVIDPKGDANGNFNPDEYVNRETFAKILDLSNTVYEKGKLEPGAAAEGGTTGNTSNPVEQNTGSTNGNGSTTVEEPKEPTDEPGAKADVVAYVDEAIPEYGNLSVFVGTEKKVYKVADNATCTIDGITSYYWKLKKSDLVNLYLSNEKIVKIVGESKIQKIIGKLVSIETKDKTLLTIETDKGETKKYAITEKTAVVKDGKVALWQELKNGNSLVITTSYDELVEINADGVKSTDKGVIESIVFSRMAPPKIVVTALDGSQNTYFTSKGIEIAGIGNDIYLLRPGMQVDVNLIDDEISKISVANAANENATIEVALNGQIKQIDQATKLIVVEVYDKSTGNYVEKRVFLTDETRIGDAYLNILSIKDLKVSQLVDIRGTGSTEGIYAKVIQIR
ncbi:MAG: S-layer homology domain-containing protein [Caulobacteraceae bacterium]